MKTSIHVCYCVAEFFLEWEGFQKEFVKNVKTHILCSIAFSRKSCRLWYIVEKYCRAGQAIDDNIIGHMSLPCWMIKATDTHSEYVIFIPFPLHQWLRERPSILNLYAYCPFFTPYVFSVSM